MILSAAVVSHECSSRRYNIIGYVIWGLIRADIFYTHTDDAFFSSFLTFFQNSILPSKTASHVIDVTTFLDINECADSYAFEAYGVHDSAGPFWRYISDDMLARKV